MFVGLYGASMHSTFRTSLEDATQLFCKFQSVLKKKNQSGLFSEREGEMSVKQRNAERK